MQIFKVYPQGFGANSYIVTADGERALVVDPSGEKVLLELDRRRLTPEYVLLTHCHFDHVGGVAALQSRGARVLLLDKEKPLVGTNADLFALFGEERTEYTADGTFTDGEVKTLCGLSVKAIATPGHTAGSVSYLLSDGETRALFTGDTLFQGSIGRTDFPTGDGAELSKSLQKLAALEGDLPVFAGHGEDTTLEEERRNNPFLR